MDVRPMGPTAEPAPFLGGIVSDEINPGSLFGWTANRFSSYASIRDEANTDYERRIGLDAHSNATGGQPDFESSAWTPAATKFQHQHTDDNATSYLPYSLPVPEEEERYSEPLRLSDFPTCYYSEDEGHGIKHPPTINQPCHDYALRESARKNVIPTTWLDKDESGNYDPTAKPVLPHLRKRKRSGDIRHVRRAPVLQRAFTGSWQQARQLGISCVAVLGITSRQGKDLISKYTDNWPVEPRHWLNDEDLSLSAESSAESGDENNRSYKLRKRNNCNPTPHIRSSCLVEDELEHQTYNHFDHPLRNQPVGRGCRSCYALGIRCPLLVPGSSYPCGACAEDLVDCELVVPPRKKQECESCRNLGIPCSYADPKEDHSSPCDYCFGKDQYCVAGPLSDRSRVRIGGDGKPVVQHSPVDAYRLKPCNACKSTRSRCSLVGVKSNRIPPCTACTKNGVECSHEPLVLSRRQRPDEKPSSSKQTQPLLQTEPAPESDLKSALHDNERIITTSLPLPIHFGEPINPDRPCHWCDEATFGLYGRGERKVRVALWPTGTGVTEISGGHVSDDAVEESRMCQDCMLPRILVLNCTRHSMRKVPVPSPPVRQQPASTNPPSILGTRSRDLDLCSDGTTTRATAIAGKRKATVTATASSPGPPATEEQAWQRALTALIASKPGMRRYRLQQAWCALCLNLAAHECCASDEGDGSEGDSAGAGCGLRLCDLCAFALTHVWDGDLGAMVEGTDLAVDVWSRGVRADCGLYAAGGWLVRYLELCG